MSGKIPREFIDDILVRVDIVDLIDSHVPLKKTGSNFVARCPFHNEKTPSFSVSRKKQFYHCFGCGVGGNAISFLMEYSHLGFVEAVEDLASFVGVDVPKLEGGSSAGIIRQDHSGLYVLLSKVAAFYVEQLKRTPGGKKAVEYLKSRGLSGELARDFALGYAPESRGVLLSKFNQKDLMDSGMLGKNESGRVYERFRGRLMFPIRDKRKRVIGFGGRVLDDSLPKYLNSPETAVFSKGREVYGLYELLEKNSKPQRILIVEGYMDVIALAQYGIDYAVATLGTATSKTHLDVLFRFSSELVFCFDGDKAGSQAAWRAMEVAFPCLTGKRLVKFMILPQGEDPDSLVRTVGKEDFDAKVKGAQTLSEYFFESLTHSLNLMSIDGKAKLLAEGGGYLKSMPNGFSRNMMFKDFEQLVGPFELEISKNQTTLKKMKRTPLRIVIASILQNPEFAEVLEEQKLDWELWNFPESELLKGIELLQSILRTIEVNRPENAAILLELYRGSEVEKEVYKLANFPLNPEVSFEFDEEAEFRGALQSIIRQGREQHYEYLMKKQANEGLSEQEKKLWLSLLKPKNIS